MIRSVWRVVQNADDADDAFQEATATIWRQMHRIRVHRNSRAFVLRICVNAACDILRRKVRRGVREQALDRCHRLPGADGDVSAELENQERQMEITRAIAQLSESQATAVTMHYLLDCPYGEIVDALDCAESTARVHASRGLERLRSLLAHLDPNPTEDIR